jgi:hypothetical protein
MRYGVTGDRRGTGHGSDRVRRMWKEECNRQTDRQLYQESGLASRSPRRTIVSAVTALPRNHRSLSRDGLASRRLRRHD